MSYGRTMAKTSNSGRLAKTITIRKLQLYTITAQQIIKADSSNHIDSKKQHETESSSSKLSETITIRNNGNNTETVISHL